MKLIDGFKNIIKGLGTSKDARMNTYYAQGSRIDQITANNLYVYNWMARKVVDIPIDDATRKWRNLLIPDADKKKEIEEALKKFEVKNKINQAYKWARVFGGAVIDESFLISNWSRFKKGSISTLVSGLILVSYFKGINSLNISLVPLSEDILPSQFNNIFLYLVSILSNNLLVIRRNRFEPSPENITAK